MYLGKKEESNMSIKYIKELKEQLKGGTYYYYKCGLLIKGKVKLVMENSTDILNVTFEGGVVDVYIEKIKLIRRPSNIIEKFEWCYILKNHYNEVLGYIGKAKKDKVNQK